MVDFVARHNRFSSFVESLVPLSVRGEDVFRLLSLEVVQITRLDQNPSTNTLAGCIREFLPTLTSHDVLFYLLSSPFLQAAYTARVDFFKVYTCLPGFGWPTLLIGMWVQLRVMQETDTETPEEKLELQRQFRDITARYLLVAPPHEYCVVGTIAEDHIGNINLVSPRSTNT